MKYLFVILALSLTACGNPEGRGNLPNSIGKFTDGDVTCYTYYQTSISCVKNQ